MQKGLTAAEAKEGAETRPSSAEDRNGAVPLHVVVGQFSWKGFSVAMTENFKDPRSVFHGQYESERASYSTFESR